MRKKILIMDDEEMLCKAAAEFLIEHGYDAYYELDGHEGLKSLEKKSADLLLLDIRMPRVDGLQVLDEITQRYPHLRVVVISGYLDKEITLKVIEHGAAACIDKPFRVEELLERVIEPLIGGPIQ
jgi:DNA-binding response OmpR family regulator